ESPQVESAMVAFGGRLKAIDRAVADQLPNLGEAISSKDPKDARWYGPQQVRQTLSNLRSSPHLNEKLSATVRDLSRKKVSKEDVQALRDTLEQQLIPAIEAGVDAPLSRSRSLPAAY